MTTTIQDAIAEIQAVVGTVAGIRLAPNSAPDQIETFPAAICYPKTVDWRLNDSSFLTGLHQVVIEIHMTKAPGLARAIAVAAPYGELVVKALYQAFVAHTFTTLQTTGRITGEFGPLNWDTTDTIGWRITIEGVKLQQAIT